MPAGLKSLQLDLASPVDNFTTPCSSPPHAPLSSPPSLGHRRLDAFHIVCLIGKGSFGKVFLVRHKATAAVYAMKVMDKHALIERRAVSDAHAERNILAMVGQRHLPFIVRLHVAFQTAARVYLVMDFASGGELMFHLRREAMLSENDARFYAAQLLLALEALHNVHVVHRDIKPENILLDDAGHLVLTDFGLAKDISGLGEQTHSWCGSEDYMAPEVISRTQHTGKPADYWAYGIFIYDCLCGQPPFSPLHERGKLPRNKLHQRILKMKPKLPSYLSKECHALLRLLLQKDPSKRLTDPQLIRDHPWFDGIDWKAMANKQIAPPIVPPQSSLTACFSPTITRTNLSNLDSPTPHSPAATMSCAIPVPHLQPPAENLWQGFSFVAPGMEVHFELAPPAPSPAPLTLGAASVIVGSPDPGSGLLASMSGHSAGGSLRDNGDDAIWEDALVAEFEAEAKKAVEIFE